ncbi:carbohydrate ABC transporter permease [Amycolatopsis echigonensis]|uniref:Cellobiose ABC transporter membrane protein n=1 Tax=Amycolatopsis echigonensis TaxID=2576905 RepID=A0A2N3WK63_9PSEU|nr:MULTISPECIES: sugar ABC transporter permease [Amycolatopsis]MBB2500127.1 sugar ABC transporter permease [Amycolatopsis echigonensis]PKV94270.1 cellobiose ABC transporter membrane protein [Amycolatopsis niigatensis]
MDRKLTPYVFILPFFVLFGLFGAFPLLYTSWVSLHRWDLLSGPEGGLGLANYVELFGDPRFYNALFNTVSIFLLAAIPQFFLALGIAALLNRPLRAATWWRAGLLLPNLVSVVAVGLVFAQLYSSGYGVVNEVLGWFGVPPVSWQAHQWSSHLAVASMVMWRWTGYNALIYLAAMQAVPQDLYEAAALDGASRWRSFWSITVPGIRPTIAFTVVAGTVNGLQLFAEPQLFDATGNSGAGGNDRQFQTLTMYLYEKGFGKFDAGYAAALSWVMFLICLVFAIVNYRLVRRFVGAP